MIYEILEDRAVQEISTSPTAEVEILALDICKCSCCCTLDSSEQDEGNTILAPSFGSDKAGCSLAAINSYRYNFNPGYLEVTALTNSFPVAENSYSCLECQTILDYRQCLKAIDQIQPAF